MSSVDANVGMHVLKRDRGTWISVLVLHLFKERYKAPEKSVQVEKHIVRVRANRTLLSSDTSRHLTLIKMTGYSFSVFQAGWLTDILPSYSQGWWNSALPGRIGSAQSRVVERSLGSSSFIQEGSKRRHSTLPSKWGLKASNSEVPGELIRNEDFWGPVQPSTILSQEHQHKKLKFRHSPLWNAELINPRSGTNKSLFPFLLVWNSLNL